ncbi:MAG: hypothetical protein V4819_02325 [Verrucomicrobiota bacterium]
MRSILPRAPLRHKRTPRRNHPPGFALVVTLSLMILLTVIAVGLLSLASVSLRSSSQNDAMQSARANARLALMLAINQIQKTTGPDQRVTVPADQRSKTSDGKQTAAAPGNLRWTGVYRSWPATSSTRPTPDFLSWLVSGDPAKTGTATLPDTAAPNSVELVGAGTLGASNTEGRISVPTISVLQHNKPARLAWWVGDQAAKAALATPPVSTDKTSLGVVRGNLQSAPRSAVESSTSGTVKPFEKLAIDDARLALVTSWRQSEHLASDPTAPRGLFHDLAPGSTGMLTNVASGGFRKDLSLQLESPVAKNPASKSLYTVGGENGINFQELWSYYNSYKNIVRSGGYKYSTSGTFASGTPYMMVGGTNDSATLPSSAAVCADDDNFYFKQPTILSYQLVLSFKSFPITTGSGASAKTAYQVHVVADPIVTLWNPLDIPLVIPPNAFISISYWQVPYSLDVKINGNPAFTTASPLASTLSGTTNSVEEDMHYLTLKVGNTAATQMVFKPGEVIKFSQNSSTQMEKMKDTIWIEGKKGFSYAGGFATPLKDLAGKILEVTSGSTLTYTAAANNVTAGQFQGRGRSTTGLDRHTRHYSLTHHDVLVGEDDSKKGPGVGYGGMYIDWDFGDKRLKAGSALRGTSTPGTKPVGQLLFANNFPDVFKPLKAIDSRPLSFGQLRDEKSPFLLVSFDAKTEFGSSTGTRFLSRFNPKAHQVDFYDLSKKEMDVLPYEFRAEPLVSWVNRSLDVSVDGSGFYGGGMNAQDGTGIVTTHSIPREPLVSIASLQHSFANGFEFIRPTGGINSSGLNDREPMLPQISHAIGNSLAPPMLAPDKTEGTLLPSRPLADHSYLANRGLWDDWFFSGIASKSSKTFPANKTPAVVASEFFSKTSKLPVVRYQPQLDGQNPATFAKSLFSGASATDAAIQNVASYLRVDGLFNVNSTSIEAWKAVLGGLKGRPIVVRDATGKESIAPSTSDKTPVLGIQSPQDVVVKGSGTLDVKDASQWLGRRELSDDEIDQLARALVIEIRKRGPFLSLADFVNRRVGTDQDLAKAGAIQCALDSDDVAINKAFRSGSRSLAPPKATFAFPKAEEGPMAYGIPGYVKQADILTPIAPVLSVRSDSFIVRAYGEAVDASGKVTGRAWCEAVVERDRNFVDPADPATTAIASLSKQVNRTFGRRYQILSFRWLSAAEV